MPAGVTTVTASYIPISNAGPTTQTITLNAGYNLVSLNVVPENTNMLSILDSIKDNVDLVKNASGQTLRKVNNVWTNNIGNWLQDQGYLIKMNTQAELAVTGENVTVTPITLTAGYNIVPYYGGTAENAASVFGSIPGLELVKDASGNTLRKVNGSWVDNIPPLSSGKAYLIKVSEESDFSY